MTEFVGPESSDAVWSGPTGPRITVAVAGEVDMLTMPQLDDVLGAAVASCEVGVDIDMSAVTFMGSTGLRCLVHGHRQATHLGVDFVVVNPSDWVRQLLAKTDLEHLLVSHLEQTAQPEPRPLDR